MPETAVYQSVLKQLSALPPEGWLAVEKLLSKMSFQSQPIEKDPKGILQFAGSWSTWDDGEFDTFLNDLYEQKGNWFSHDFIS